jgi:hypothetical protein
MKRQQLFPSRALRDRYQICDRTLARWVQDPKLNFPQPIRINGRMYFSELELDEFDHRRASPKEQVAA